MASVATSAAIERLKSLLDAYGIAVRAGAITPCQEDESAFREMMGLPEMPAAVAMYWAESKGVRKPITLNYENATSKTDNTGAPQT